MGKRERKKDTDLILTQAENSDKLSRAGPDYGLDLRTLLFTGETCCFQTIGNVSVPAFAVGQNELKNIGVSAVCKNPILCISVLKTAFLTSPQKLFILLMCVSDG